MDTLWEQIVDHLQETDHLISVYTIDTPTGRAVGAECDHCDWEPATEALPDPADALPPFPE